jgi:hypothetical protein
MNSKRKQFRINHSIRSIIKWILPRSHSFCLENPKIDASLQEAWKIGNKLLAMRKISEKN